MISYSCSSIRVLTSKRKVNARGRRFSRYRQKTTMPILQLSLIRAFGMVSTSGAYRGSPEWHSHGGWTCQARVTREDDSADLIR